MLKSRYIFIPLFLLVLFVTYQVNISMFSHIHYVNGVMIVHSHPSADNQHTHTESQILTLAQMAQWTGMQPEFVSVDDACFQVLDMLECRRKSPLCIDRYALCVCLRAPPSCYG